jgi:integrase
MVTAIDTYLAMRRATGFTLSTQEYLLRSFARFAGDRQQAHIRSATAIDWAGEAVSLAQRHARYQTVCRFATYVHLEDDRHDCPPANYFGYHRIRRVPHIYSAIEIHRLIRAAEQLVPTDSLRPFSYAALISLLAATGLRISEALHLLISDITPDGLLIRKTKFQKTRLVPLHQTAVSGLRRYLEQRQRMRCGGDHVFVSNTGLPLAYWKVQGVFRKLLKTAELIPSQGRVPRLHDFRHTFAVRALEASPTGRRRIGRHMVALATYLGHVNIDATYWYLQSTPELLSDIAAASEAFFDGGR